MTLFHCCYWQLICIYIKWPSLLLTDTVYCGVPTSVSQVRRSGEGKKLAPITQGAPQGSRSVLSKGRWATNLMKAYETFWVYGWNKIARAPFSVRARKLNWNVYTASWCWIKYPDKSKFMSSVKSELLRRMETGLWGCRSRVMWLGENIFEFPNCSWWCVSGWQYLDVFLQLIKRGEKGP